MASQSAVDKEFVLALPKVELHAHLSGSVGVECLRRIWTRKRALGQCDDLEDPAIALRPDGEFHDVISFFPLFDRYIYNLCNDLYTVKEMTTSVLQSFCGDGVVHLELRTTPRDNATSGLTKEGYVIGVLEAIRDFDPRDGQIEPERRMETTLILSIDRRMTGEQADGIVDLAIKYQHPARRAPRADPNAHDGGLNGVVGIDLCGNPMRGHVETFTEVFRRAKANGLGITVHFAEVPQSSSDGELETLLSWSPDRIGHVIHVKPRYIEAIEERRIGLELCLSCNVLAKLTTGGFATHHFGRWRNSSCPVALGTDDVGIFGSPLSNEYLLAATHFNLSREEVLSLSKSATEAVFTGQERLLSMMEGFENEQIVQSARV